MNIILDISVLHFMEFEVKYMLYKYVSFYSALKR